MFRTFVSAAQYDRFTPAREQSLTFQFAFAPKLASTTSLQDHEVSAKGSLTYDQLPAEFRTRVEESAKAAAMMKAPSGRIKP
ncbi:hypothetical protein EON77_00335 [bacterium]|nr:MAG: hypothetical protein EON77_00335 [bacterium]